MSVVPFPKANRGAVLISSIDDESATIRMDVEHLNEAIIMYLSLLSNGFGQQYDIVDVDLGVEVDDDGYVEMDVYFPLAVANDP